MSAKSIDAYDAPQRVAQYDRDMDVMHPLRHKMFDVALEVLPIPRDAEFTAIELGMGTGTFSQRILAQFPKARLIAIDGAETMLRWQHGGFSLDASARTCASASPGLGPRGPRAAAALSDATRTDARSTGDSLGQA